MGTIINEIKEITANQVAKKQDAAKLHFPTLIEKIKATAARGESETTVAENEINEYDRKLLKEEGFIVTLIDEPLNKFNEYKQIHFDRKKAWSIRW